MDEAQFQWIGAELRAAAADVERLGVVPEIDDLLSRSRRAPGRALPVLLRTSTRGILVAVAAVVVLVAVLLPAAGFGSRSGVVRVATTQPPPTKPLVTIPAGDNLLVASATELRIVSPTTGSTLRLIHLSLLHRGETIVGVAAEPGVPDAYVEVRLPPRRSTLATGPEIVQVPLGGGPEKIVAQGSEAAVSPDGKWLVSDNDGRFDVTYLPTGAHRVVSPVATVGCGPRCVPDLHVLSWRAHDTVTAIATLGTPSAQVNLPVRVAGSGVEVGSQSWSVIPDYFTGEVLTDVGAWAGTGWEMLARGWCRGRGSNCLIEFVYSPNYVVVYPVTHTIAIAPLNGTDAGPNETLTAELLGGGGTPSGFRLSGGPVVPLAGVDVGIAWVTGPGR